MGAVHRAAACQCQILVEPPWRETGLPATGGVNHSSMARPQLQGRPEGATHRPLPRTPAMSCCQGPRQEVLGRRPLQESLKPMKDSTPVGVNVADSCESTNRAPSLLPSLPFSLPSLPRSPKPASWHLGLFQLNAFPRQRAPLTPWPSYRMTCSSQGTMTTWFQSGRGFQALLSLPRFIYAQKRSTSFGPLLLCRQAWADCQVGASQQRVWTRQSASTASTNPQTKYACCVFCALPRLAQSTYASRWNSFDHYQDILGG